MREDKHLFWVQEEENPEWLFLENMRSVLGACTEILLDMLFQQLIIYALLTKHEVKKLDILRFMDRKFPIVFTLIWGGALFDEKWKCEIWNMKTSNWGLERRAWAFPWEHPHIRLPSLLPLFRVSFEYRSLSFRIQITQSKNKNESFVDQARIYDKYWPISWTSAEGVRFSGGGGVRGGRGMLP